MTGFRIAKSGWERWRETRTYTVTVSSDDPAYPAILDWVRELLPEQKQRALVVASDMPHHHEPISMPDISRDDDAPRVRIAYDNTSEQRITVDGRRVHVWIDRPDDLTTAVSRVRPDKIRFRAHSLDAQRVVLLHLAAIASAHRRGERKPQLWMLAKWGDWCRRSDIPLRTVESVVLRDGQMERLVNDLGLFLSREQDYLAKGIPWRRGYLLCGPPGTGKTSVAKALAHEHGLDLWYAPLGDLDKDCNLLSLVGEVRQRSILLLEDVDVYHAATERTAEPGTASLAGLLNALDGVTTPHGLISIITCNDPDVLQEALVRPGRVSLTEHLGYIDEDQARRLFRFFYDREPRREWLVPDGTSPAALTELFTEHLDDPDTAEATLVHRTRVSMNPHDRALRPVVT